MTVPKVERQVNLVIALLETRRPLTLEEIKARTGYYDQADDRAARQMFERDKRELRAAGVPIATEPPGPFDAADGYIIHRADYEQPDLDLSEAEVTALAAARRVIDRDAQELSLVRLTARSAAASPGPGVAATSVALATGPVEAFAEPLAQRRAVRFAYRTAEGREGERTVDPYAVATRNGNWYLIGRDHERDDQRAFRLDRVLGAIEVLDPANAFQRPAELDLDRHLSVPGEQLERVVLRVHRDVVHQALARGGVEVTDGADPDWATVEFAQQDRYQLAGWITSVAGRVRVVEPGALASEVRARLAAVLEAHR